MRNTDDRTMDVMTAPGFDDRRVPRPATVLRRMFTLATVSALVGAPSVLLAQTSATQTTTAPESAARATAAEEKKADPPPAAPPPGPTRPWFGGLGYASVAPFFGELSTPKAGLQAPEVLGASYGVGKASILLGGGGGAVLFGHLWLGGKGYGLLTERFDNARGEAMLTGGGGGFEIGYVLAAQRKMLIIPFFGAGGFGYRLTLTNRTPQPMTVLQAVTIPSGQSKDFTAGFATLDIGIRVQRLIFIGDGGFSAGFEFGLLRSLSTSPWHSGPYQFTHERGATLDGAYFRLNVGGGGFFFR